MTAHPTPQASQGTAPVTAPRRVVMLSLHTSPLDQAGTGDAGGMNTFVDYLSRGLRESGLEVDIVTASQTVPLSAAQNPAVQTPAVQTSAVRTLPDGRRLITLSAAEDQELFGQTAELARAAAAALRTASSTGVDAVHSHYWISGVAGLQLARNLGVPLVHTMHTVAAVKRERDPHLPTDLRREAQEREIARRAAVVTANTVREAQDLARLYPEAAARIRLMRPGVDLEIFRPDGPASAPESSTPENSAPESSAEAYSPPADSADTTPHRPLRLTFAGRLQPHKGPQVAVAAVGCLRRRRPDLPLRLTIAGELSGPLPLDIAVLAEEAGISELTEQIGPLPHRQLAQLLRSSDVVLMPSYSESFGFVALEAMACATPVIAHAVGGLTELIDSGNTGVLVESLEPEAWADALEALLDSGTRTSIGSAAAGAARDYSWASTAAQALRIYSDSRDFQTGS